mgnify:CR=1 FL=1
MRWCLMPTVECTLTDCRKHGIEICIAKRVKWKNGECSEYDSRAHNNILDPPFKSNCNKGPGGYKSSRVTGVLK